MILLTKINVESETFTKFKHLATPNASLLLACSWEIRSYKGDHFHQFFEQCQRLSHLFLYLLRLCQPDLTYRALSYNMHSQSRFRCLRRGYTRLQISWIHSISCLILSFRTIMILLAYTRLLTLDCAIVTGGHSHFEVESRANSFHSIDAPVLIVWYGPYQQDFVAVELNCLLLTVKSGKSQ